MPYVIPQEVLETNSKKAEDVGFFESALAGVATGLWNIPKGFVSLGAEIYDLAADANTAKEVEKWFDDVNPFDDEAEARTIGKITQAIAQIAPVAIGGASLGARAAASFKNTNLAKTMATHALEAKKAGKYMSLARIGQKFTGPTAGMIAGGAVGEGIVADEDIGTLADILKGTSLEPYAITMMDRETKEGRDEAYRRLLNRVKFGTEGALFNLALLGAGRGIQKLRKPGEDLAIKEYSENVLKRGLEKFGILGLRPEGPGTKLTFEAQQSAFGQIKAVEYGAGKAVDKFTKAMDEVFPAIEKNYLLADKGITTSDAARTKFLDEIYDILAPASGKSEDVLLKEVSRKRAIEAAGKIDPTKPQALFKYSDYQLTPKLKKILQQVKDAGGDPRQLRRAIINFRQSIDNMSGRFLQGTLPKETADTIKSQLGKYLTTEYKMFNQLNPFQKYKPTAEQLANAKRLLMDDRINGFVRRNGLESPEMMTIAQRVEIEKAVDNEINQFLKIKSMDELDLIEEASKGLKEDGVSANIARPTKEEIQSVNVNPSVLKQRVLLPWQRELAGVIKDPRYTFYSTVGKQAHLNYTLRYMDEIARIGSNGKNKFIFNADEIADVDKLNPLKFKKVQKGAMPGLSKLEGKYIRAPQYDAIFDVTSNWLNRSSVGTMYKYMILGPKAVSQISKTILSPITHMRNFISAGAFAAANGAIFPNFGDIKTLAPKFLGGQGVFGEAKRLTYNRIMGTMTKADDALYERLLRVGVTDSNVVRGESQRLLKDVLTDPQAAEANAFRNLADSKGRIQKIYGKLQDAYVGEDDFWKIVTWNLERNRYEDLAKRIGITKDNYLSVLAEDSARGNYFRKLTPRAEYAAQSYQNFLDELAGNLVRNNVPNYGYVGRTARALRQSPFGNFIAFPLEIMRTGNNIFQTSIDEITSGIPELVSQGYRRLFSFGTTVGGIPAVTAEIYKAKNNVSNDEMEALRRFVPEWSKNSVLVPTGRDEKGYLKYIDFSYSNAYDALLRPYRAVLNEIADGEATNASLKQSLAKGLTDGFIELMQPFASESIFTEALLDSTFRRGIGRGGRPVWSESDDPFVKIQKGVFHVAKSLEPGSIQQFKRLSYAARGKTDPKYGESFDLQNELPGLMGFRNIQSNPEKGLIFMTTRFGSSLKKDENLFTYPLLRGGRVSSKDIVDVYKYSESRRFQTMREMYKNIDAARRLGMSDAKIRKTLSERKGLSKDVVNSIMRGDYLPDRPSKFFVERMNKINRDLNEKEGVSLPNPYYQALPIIIEIINENRNKDLLGDELKLPEEPPILQRPTPQASIQTPQLNTPQINNQVVAQNSTAFSPTNQGLTPVESALLSEEEKQIRLRQRGLA